MRFKSVLAMACFASASPAAYAYAQQGTAPADQAGTPLQTPQTTQPPVGVSSTPPQSTPASAAPSGPATVETVIVTANRRAENLQNVPVSVTAVSGANLVNSGVTNLQDLSAVVPGLVVQNGGFATNHLRGVGSSTVGPGLENAIALYVDGVYYASAATNLVDFVDVSQVEVLKGPQGTLFGRNATGGLIQVTTKTPTHDPHFDADLSYGNYETGKGDLYVSGGLTDNLAADFAIQASAQGQGYGYNHATGDDVYKTDSRVDSRSKWVWDVTPKTKVTTIFDYSQVRYANPAITLIPGTNVLPFVGPTYRYSNPWDTDTDGQPLTFSKSGGVSTKVEQDLGFARFNDIVAYRQSSFFSTFDVDATATPLERTYLQDREHTFTEEAQLQSEKGDRIQYTAGIFYFSNDGKYAPGSQIQFPGAFSPAAPLDAIGTVGEEVSTSAAGYIQGTTEILPATNLTLGARYTYERRTIAGSETGVVGNDIPIATLVTASNAKNFYRPTFRVALDHRFSPQVLAYATANTGFKSGGFNTQNITDPAFAPETLNAYEAGLKTDLLDRRLRLNGSFFYYDYNHIQVLRIESGGSTGVINGPHAVSYGADIDAEARITQALTFTGGLEYVHDRFTSSNPGVPTGVEGGGVPVFEASAQGNRLPVTPDAVVDLKADYRFDLIGGQANADVTYQYNTGWFSEPDNIIHQPPFSLLNASLRWKSPQNTYTVALFATNLTNAVVQAFGSTLPTGEDSYSLAAPRLYGVTVGYHF